MNFFPENYSQSKRRFQDLVSTLLTPKEVGAWKVPSLRDADLQVDYAYFPALDQPKNLILILSGVHGAEAYTGSAIQTLFLTELFPQLRRKDTGFLLVHALNPFGFKHHQRCTENLVNLNRNCSASPALYQMKNPRSLELSKKFIPAQPLRENTSPLLKSLRKQGDRVFFGDTSMDELIKGVGPGQYESSEGLEFGGFRPEPQITAWIEYLRKIMPGYKDIFLFDIHTGLGERGRLHLLTGDPKMCLNTELFHKILDPASDQEIYAFTENEAEGFYETFGATNDLVAELTGPSQRVCALTLEFGTLGHSFENQIDSLDRWLLEHQATTYGCESEELREEIRNKNLEKFFPQDLEWQRTILETARKFFSRVHARLKLI